MLLMGKSTISTVSLPEDVPGIGFQKFYEAQRSNVCRMVECFQSSTGAVPDETAK